MPQDLINLFNYIKMISNLKKRQNNIIKIIQNNKINKIMKINNKKKMKKKM